jgi:hypothetical protein
MSSAMILSNLDLMREGLYNAYSVLRDGLDDLIDFFVASAWGVHYPGTNSDSASVLQE